ncbi:Uncharacterized protein GBIM_12563 [Gryllus bimaculatus]|nr:Uncharacterized protein GBIM_12563 [Gryllus bimaculatus]
MEERFIKLCNVSNCIPLHEYQSMKISTDVKYVYIQLLNNKALLYYLSRNNEYTEGPIWESSDVSSCIFSDEGNEFMVISIENCCRIYRLLEASIVLLREISLEELSLIIGEFDIELTCESVVKLHKFNKKTVIVFVNNVWLIILKWGSEDILLAHNKIEVASCVTINIGLNAIYTLTAGGNVSAYDQNDGGQLGVVHIYAMVPPSRVMDVLSFKYLSVNLDGTSLAVSDRASQVFLIKVKNAFAMDDVSEHQNSRWDCGTSIRSFGSDVSRLTSASRVQPKVLPDTISLSSSITQDSGDSTSYKVTWNSYIQSLQKSSFLGISEDQYSCMQKLSDPPEGLTVRGLQLRNGELSVWFTEPDAQTGGIYYLHDLVNNTCIEQQLPDDTVVIPGGLVGLKDAFLSPRGLFMFLGTLPHDVLVSKMLHCMQRESLGRLLQGETWTNLMVPLPAVVVALKQQQLDVVQLALSLHVHGLKSTFLNIAEYEENGWKDKMRKLMADLEELLLVIQQSCTEYAQKPALHEQLIASTLEQINRLLECLCGKKLTLAFEFAEQIMLHVIQLRKHLLGQSITREARETKCEYKGCPMQLSAEWEKWNDMSDEDVIQDAIMKNCVPLSQVFFIKVRSWPKSSIHSQYHNFVDNWVSLLLEESDFEKAEMILWIVGKDPDCTLLRICVETEHHKLRDRLAQHLTEKGLFPRAEMNALNFLKQVEKILDIIDFSSLGTRSDAKDKVFLNIHLNEDKIPLCAVLEKSDEWRQFVLISLFFNVPGAGHLESMLQCEFVWLYLLENNREDLLCTWITCALSENSWETIPLCVEEWAERLKAIPVVTAVEECSYISAESLLNIFKRWFITEDMVNSVTSANAMTTIKEIVLNHLSRFGVFSSSEKADVRAILKRTIFTGNVGNLKSVLNQKSGNVTYTEFQILLTKHLINNDLYDIAFPCLEDFEYSDRLLEDLCNTDQDHGDWLPLWLTFRDMKKKPGDKTAIYNVILKNAQYLSKGDLKIYLKEHPVVVLALLVYEGRSIADVFTSNEDISNIDRATLSATLNQYPLLERAVTSFTNPSEETPDITLYQLLEGNSPFDVSKLFGWQKSHRIEGEEFPHFTCPKLVDKYGIEYKMTYLIYLKLARPCFAACRFVIDQYKTYATLSHKRIKDAVNAAHGLALQNFDDEEITASCLAFTEILGEDSCRLKVDLCSVRKIFSYFQNNEEENKNIEQIGEMLYEMRQHNSEAATQLLHFLEIALQKEIGHSIQIGKKSMEEIAHWGLAVKFARSHGLKLPEVFLRQLTSENNLFLFMMFIEIYRYPLHQVKDLSKSFSSLILQEHLFHILQVEVTTESKEDSIHLVPRDARKTLYSKILPKKPKLKQEDALPVGKPKKLTKRRRETDHPDQQKGATDKIMDLAASLSSGSSGEEAVGSSLISYDVWREDDNIDLFLVLLKCHNAEDPLRALLHETYALQNPILAVLATCYDLGMVIPCFCAWMIISLPHPNSERLLNELGKSSQDLVWTEDEVLRILEEAVSCRFIRTLQHGCWIFFPDNPLGDLMDFLYEAIILKDFEECLLRMKSFKAALLNLKNNDLNQSLDFIGNGLWLGRVAVQLTKAAVSFALTSLQFVLEFLAVMREGNFLDHLPEPLPDFELVEQVLKCLSLTGVFPNMAALLNPAKSLEHQNEVNRCLQELSQSKQFSCALQLASASGLCRDPVLVAQWSDKFEQSAKRPLGRSFLGFWKKCDDTFHSEKVYPHTAAKFFQFHAEKLTDLEEKFHVLQLAVSWLQEALLKVTDFCPVDFKKEMASVELNMWNCWLQASYELPLGTENTNPEMLYSTKNVILEQAGVTDMIISPEISNEEKQKVHVLLGKLLDLGSMVSACRVEAMYGVKHQDLNILLLCLGLAEGTVSPYELTSEQRLLFSEVSTTRTLSHRRRALMSSISTLSHSPGTNSLLVDYVEIPPRDRQDTLTALEKLTGRLEHGTAIGNRVVMCYRVAMNLDLNYLEVLVMREPLNLLKTALADDCLNKFIVASDIITAAQINSTEVAEFMAREILEAVTKSKLKGEVSGTTMWGIELESCFHLVLDVCRDQASLGNKLLSLASLVTTSRAYAFHDAHVIAVELVIHAHNCFVAALNMEGIGSVLQMCQTITTRLLKKEEWGLMVRLLTGVERYTEMSYIFKILYDHEQFEFLLAKGLDKVKGLKVAVIDFLKKRCPGDRKLYEMVTLRFGMFEEVAVLWESDGLAEEEAVLKLILKDQNGTSYSLLPHNEVVKRHLMNAMECFKHAAEFFIKGELLIRATHLVHHAELVALQRYFISTVSPGQGAPLLLRLSSEEVANLVTHVLTFPQGYLVVRAYDHPVDWAAALYHHCVLKGDESYFTAFTTSIPLNSSMVEDVVRRFQVLRNITADNARMMKMFIEQVDSLELKYRLASQLGFRDLIESLLNGPEDDVAYLKDTVWQHGFRS